MSFQDALAHFEKVDPVLWEVGRRISPLDEIVPAPPSEYFVNLCDSIVSQQLSTKVATVIWNRVLDLFPGGFTSQEVLLLPDEKFRLCGVSGQKIRYIKDLASRDIAFSEFPHMSEEEITQKLVAVKGIGPWTAEMFLMFTMGKSDIFSPGDLGLRNAIERLPGLKQPYLWSPYRSYASRILWKSLELPSETK